MQEAARKAIEEACCLLDEQLMHERPSTLRCRGYREVKIPSLFGELRLKRRLYEAQDWVEGKPGERYRFLLDEFLGLPGGGKPSPGLIQLAVQLFTDLSFRRSAKALEAMGLPISHQTLHQWKEQLGRARRKEQERQRQGEAPYDDSEGSQSPSPKVVFAEADGVYVRLQREKKKSAEIKAGIIYNGWQKRSPGGKDYRLVKKDCYAGVDSSEEFWESMQLMVAERCDIGSTPVVLNTDGDAGLAKGVEYFPKNVYQLDRFHWIRDTVRAFRDDEKSYEAVFRAIEHGDAKALNQTFAQAIEEEKDEKKQERLLKLCDYLNKHFSFLKPYYERAQDELGKLDISLRNLGAMEANIYHIVAHRMKNRGCAWTKAGADNMARLLALKAKGTLEAWVDKPGRIWELEKMTPQTCQRARQRASRKETIGTGYEARQGSVVGIYGPRQSNNLHRFCRQIATIPNRT